ncbi:MAG: type II toxin-antitoxin system Phd/YefM family antitoxin [Acidobacteriales bacterium]|nr:MAG: type II toxin-antitoxin system Phd/YefM family antitoxin [Terriglobales bacterium]
MTDHEGVETISASKFKEHCLSLLDTVKPEGILITKRGKAVARLLPASADPAELIGILKGKVKIRGNILSTGIRWDAQP